MEKLVLVTTGGPDGNSHDHGIWANARLITKDGKQIWLDKLDYEYGVSGWKSPVKTAIPPINTYISQKEIRPWYIVQCRRNAGI